MRLIDADKLEDDVMERYCKDCEKRKGMKRGKWRVIYEIGEAPCRACYVDDVKMELDEAPTIDAEPIRHGKWIWRYCPAHYYCSECGFCADGYTMECIDGIFKFCLKCGAKMESVEDEELL